MATLQANSAPLSDNITEFLSDTGSSINSSKPHAFVNWILFDNQFNYVAESSGFDQVGSDQEFKKHTLMNLPVTKSGYLYIYLNNETPNINVFSDNLQVTHTRGPLTEEDHYYPFGLTMAGISDKALKGQYAENKIRFQKQELQSKEFSDGSGLEMYEFKYRMDDPQTGRFWSVDPLADKFPYNSTFAFSENHVTAHVELEGLEKESINDPNLITWGSLNMPNIVEKKVLVNGNYQTHNGSKLIERKLAIKTPKVTAAINAGGGGALKVGGLGVEGGEMENFLGVVDNHLYFAGHDYSDEGKLKKTDGISVELGGGGAGYEKEKVLKNGNWEEESTSVSDKALIFSAKTETDAKTGEQTTTFSLDVSVAVGLGLSLKAEFNLPLFTEKRTY